MTIVKHMPSKLSTNVIVLYLIPP